MGVGDLSSYIPPVNFIEGVVPACIPKCETTFLDVNIAVLTVFEHVERWPCFLRRALYAFRFSSIPVARTDYAGG